MLVTFVERIYAKSTPIALAGRIYRHKYASIGLKRLKETEKDPRTSASKVALMLQEERDVTVHSKNIRRTLFS